MKKITLLFTLILITYGTSIAQENNFDPASTAGTGWIGFMNVNETPANGGGFVFGSGWGTGDLIVVDNMDGTVSLKPNRIGDPDPFWQGTGPVGNPTGNKIMDANYYLEDDTLAGTSFTFIGEVISNTLNSSGLDYPITFTAFIKVYAADYSSFVVVDSYNLASGNFMLSADAGDSATGNHIQYGFTVNGPNVRLDTDTMGNPGYYTDDYDALGSIVIGPDLTASTNDFVASDFRVYPNPTNSTWTISASQEILNVEVFDILGKTVITQKPNGFETTIDASLLSSGIYIAKINAANGVKTMRLVRE